PASQISRVGAALFGHYSQRVRRWIERRISPEIGEIRGIAIDQREEVLLALARGTPRRSDEPFDLHAFGVDQQVDQRLKVIKIRPADIRGNNHPRASGVW